jgi:peptidoglycan/LPS O-acetylase OafA/YrhL
MSVGLKAPPVACPVDPPAPIGSLLPKFMPAIDGLRAFAVLGVVILHYPYPYVRDALFNKLHVKPLVECGWVGVDLFFVISGFLITGILLDSKGSRHYFRNFYARRALRIWPLYYAVLIFVLVIYPHVYPSGSMVHKTAPWFYYVFYLQNFVVSSRLLGVTWSLAVEEQFYITWPLVIMALSKKNLQRLIITLLAVAPLSRLVLDHYVGPHYPVETFARMDGILAGSLLALWFRSEGASISRLRKIATGLLLVGGIGSLPCLITGGSESILVYSFLAMALSGLVCFAAVDSILPRPLRALLNNGQLRYVGKISYGIYLLHPIVYTACNFAIQRMLIPLERDTFSRDAIVLLTELALTILVASLSWYFFEQPILRMKEKLWPRSGNWTEATRSFSTRRAMQT